MIEKSFDYFLNIFKIFTSIFYSFFSNLPTIHYKKLYKKSKRQIKKLPLTFQIFIFFLIFIVFYYMMKSTIAFLWILFYLLIFYILFELYKD